MKTKILFFSRGRGHGHAIPDMAIADAVQAQNPNIEVVFASYSTGAATFRSANRSVLDLELSENNPFLATLLLCQRLIKQVEPNLVVAHEEFAALPAAASQEVPSSFVSAWLPRTGTIAAEALGYAQSIIVIDNPGVFPIPATVLVKPVYTGPIFREMQYTVRDRERLRIKLGWPSNAFCVVVVPGGAATEKQTPVAEIVISAFDRVRRLPKRLIWVSSNEFDTISTKFMGLPNVEILKFYQPIECLLGAADLVITKGTRGITLDAAAVGVPSISLSSGRNPIDEILVPRIRTNLALNAEAVDAEILAEYMNNMPFNGPSSVRFEDTNIGKPAVQLVAATLIAQLMKNKL